MIYETILRNWREKQIHTGNDLDTVLENFRVLFAYHSNVIENPQITYHDTWEVFENGKVVGFTGDLRTLYEIQNQKETYEFLKEKILDKEALSVELILEIHGMLMHGIESEKDYPVSEKLIEWIRKEPELRRELWERMMK